MSISTPPTRGFTDWQRLEAWDSGILFTDNGLMVNPTFSGVIETSRFQFVAIHQQMNAGVLQHAFQWSEDQAGTHPCGSRSLVTDANISAPLQARFLNLGPFLNVEWSQLGGTQVNRYTVLFMSNRWNSLEVIPHQPFLVNAQTIALGANATVNQYTGAYFAGPASVYFTCSQICTLALQSAGVGGTYVPSWQVTTVATTPNLYSVICPQTAFRFQVTNTTAVATSFTLYVVPSFTGSS